MVPKIVFTSAVLLVVIDVVGTVGSFLTILASPLKSSLLLLLLLLFEVEEEEQRVVNIFNCFVEDCFEECFEDDDDEERKRFEKDDAQHEEDATARIVVVV